VVIGARGFIGATLMERLRAQDVPALGLTSADLDLASPQAAEKLASVLKPADAVVMLAALTPDKGRDVATLMKNLAMMQNLCAAIEKTGCAHLVYFSSDAVYSLAVARVSEETPASPQDLYGAMHYTREIMAKGLPKVPLLVLRPTLVYGAKDTHNAYGPNRFRRAGMKEGKIQLFGGGEETRDHIHVDDVAEITVRCLRHGSTGTLNLATGRSWPFSGVARIVAKQFPRPVEIVNTPRANPITHRHYDVTDLIKAFPGYRFIALEDGVARSHRESTGAA
jgi:nucleoside-diphosphate-sugar epimerase